MSLKLPTLFCIFILLATAGRAANITLVGHPSDDPSAYNVIWDSPSADARGSMPLGNGDVGANVWVEPSGDLLFYIGKTDSWEENNRLAKIGLVRVRLTPTLLPAGTTFRQELRLISGEIVITATSPDSNSITLHVWVDAYRSVIHVTIDSPVPVESTASFELWRTTQTTLPSIEVSDAQYDQSLKDHQQGPTVVEPDTVLHDFPSGIGWYHHNERSTGPQETMRQQDLLGAPWHDPIQRRIFGAAITADHQQRIDDRHLTSPASQKHHFQVHVLTLQPATFDQWLATLEQQIDKYALAKADKLRVAHEAWWRAFWARSHIDISAGKADLADSTAPTEVSRGYTLQRFITAAGGRGAYPIKYNGSIFTVPWPNTPGDADYRKWGPGYWWQNTRLIYTPLCTSGDFDLLRPLHEMYAGEMLAVSRYRTKHYFGFDDAAYFPECVYPWGAVFPESYGWEQPAAERKDKLEASRWHKWEWVGGLEFTFMLQDYFDHTGNEHFLRETLLPTALSVVRFFDKFYQVGADGKLVMHPAQAAETWWDCTNPMPEIAGLHAVIGRLLTLPTPLLPKSDREYLEKLKAKLPPLPTQEIDGVRSLAPAAQFATKKNSENPELYAVFPFRLVSFEKANAALGIEALNHRADRGAFGWRQEDIVMAYLGRTDEARDYVVQRARAKNPACRFPAFWGPNYDWTPDQCHGGVLMKSVQAMLLQTEGDRIFLLPAWPVEWNVDFKLHAPRQTLIEGEVRDGRLISLHVTPKSRAKDVVLPAGYSLPNLVPLRK